MRTPFWPRRHSKKNLSSQIGRSKKSLQRSKIEVGPERLEDRWVLAAFTAGNIAVLDLAGTSNNTTGSILEVSPSAANQAPVQTIAIPATGTNAIRFSDSGTSSFLSDSNDRTLLTFAAYNTTDTTDGDLATVTALDPASDRAVGTLDGGGNFTLQTMYTGTSGNQARSATSLDDSNFFITDKGGLYTNGATGGSLTTNILDARSFGGTVYVSSTKASVGVSTVLSPTASSLSGLPGLSADGNIQDFYLIQSGQHGSSYDMLYTLDQGKSAATINKFSLVNGSWTANGSFSLAGNATAMIAANNGSGGAYLYVVTTAQAADNSVLRLTDAAGYNATVSINTSNNVTLYTASGSDTLKGLDFVPIAAGAPTVSSPTKSAVGINSATLGGTVTTTGGEAITQRGIVYSLTSVNSNPTIGGTGVTVVPASGTSTGAFTVDVSSLQETAGYSYAAYATNSVGTGYSSVDTFSTLSVNPPSVDAPTSGSITASSATLGATVESNGGATITKTGVVYALTSANGNPQIGGTGVTEVDTASPVNSGAFTVPAGGLSPGASYTFEAFATNSAGTTYTTATGFTTLAPPTVSSPTFAAVTGSSATLGANVASDGGSTITKRGVVYALTSANSNPQIGGNGVTEVDATGTTGVFTLPVTGLAGGTSYTFEAFATNGIGTTYTAATSFSTAAANVIAAWTFPTTAGAPDNSPVPTFGSGTAATLGMTNNLTNLNGTGNTASDDVLSTSGTADPNFTENLWRIRGTPNNGWAQSAPQYSQGIELDTSTVGYSNIVFAFDWYSTTQGIRDLQVQYNTGSGWVNYQGPSSAGTFIATSNDYYNAGLSPVNPTIYVNLSGIAAANNNPDLGVRLVSAYDSTGTLGDEYASATSTPADVVAYNNSSGNWRFGNLTFYGNSTTTTTTLAADPPIGQSPGQDVTFTATVTPASGSQYPSGTVAFYDGSTQLGTTQTVTQVGSSNVGTASITLSTLSPGVHGDITAQYTPAAGNGLIASGSSMNLVVGDPTDNPISYVINAPQATGVDVSPVVGQPFTGVVATFSDGTNTNPAGFTASITWANGQTSPGTVTFAGSKDETNINGQTVTVSLFTVTGTHTYTAAGTYPLGVTIIDPNNNSTTVSPTARVAYAPLHVTAGPAVNAVAGSPISNQTVATFTDPGLVANLAALNITDPTTQFSATVDWGDGTSASAGTITYNSGTQVFSVVGSHTYAKTGPYSVTVKVTPLTVAVERVDSSDPTNLNVVGDENSNGLTDAPSPDFIDQYVIGPTHTGSFASGQSSLYTTSLPTVAAAGGNEALTNSSYSVSEGELTLSTNGQYLVLAGYNDTVSLWAPQQTFSNASVINRVIGAVDGQSNINTTTDLTDAYSGDNFRGVVSTDGTQFWTSGHAGDSSDFVHYAELGASTSTTLTGPDGASDINTVEIFNGQLYEGVRKVDTGAPAGIYQIGAGLPTTAGQPQNLFIQVPQSNPLDVSASDKPMAPFGFWMTDLPNNPDSINGVNVAYVADAEMGIARYDYTASGWHFSYYIDATGSFLDSAYTIDSQGNITPTNSFAPSNPAASADSSKAGGVRELTGRVVNGLVQIFAVTGFGVGAQPDPGGSLIEVTDPAALTVPGNGLNMTDSVVTLATEPTTDPSELTGIAFSPAAIVTSSAQVNPASPTITTTPSPNITLGTAAPTLSDSAVLADGFNETGNLVFTLTGPGGFSYTQTVPVSGNGTYTASDILPTTGTVAGTYTWHVSYAGDANNNSATDNQAVGQLGDVFYIDMENHNLTQPTSVTSPQPLMGNPAAPYLNSLMTPGNPNAAQSSWASNYYNALYNNPAVSIHPSEPNYIWQEAGLNGPLNDNDPYPNNIVNAPNLSALLQAAGILWKSYQEDIDLMATSGTVNQPGSNALTGTVADPSQWTVPLKSFSGTSAAYTNAYNGSNQYNFAVKHDGQIFFTATNGSTTTPNFSPSNPEAQYYAPLQQLQTDLNSNTVARYNLITPDQYNDMHSSLNTNFTYNGVTYTHNTDQESIAMGDNFLSQIIPMIEASQAYKNNGAIVIWFDETEGGNTTQFTVPEIILSPLAKGNAYNSTQIYTHSSDLKTMQELFGVSAPGGGFLGDANTPGTNDLADMFKPEQTVVSPANPTVTSTASQAATLGTTAPTLSDSAVLAGGYFETGNLVFTLTGPNGFTYTQTVPVSGNGTYTASDTLPTTGTVAGTYTWHVSYAGDSNNSSVVDQGGTAEQTIVSPATPTPSANAGAPVVLGTDTPLTASATLAGGYFETGTITFTLYNPSNVSVYTDTVTVAGNGSYNTSGGTATGSAVPTSAGTYQWVVSYSGDANNTAAGTAKGAAPEMAVGPGVTVIGNSLYLVGGNSTNDSLDIDPSGKSNTGSTGLRAEGRLAGKNVNATFSQTFATIYFVGFGGNEEINVAPSMPIAAVVRAGNGNDQVQLGGGTNTVTLGNGNDQVIVADGKNQIQLGNGNDLVLAGDGNNLIVAGNGNDQAVVGNGNNQIHLGNGNDLVLAGNGNNVIVEGNGNDVILAGNGDNLIVGGLGHHAILVGNGNNILIDGSVQLTDDVLEQVLGDWVANDITDVANLLTPAITFNRSNADTLLAGKGLDWFWATYAKDFTNRKPTDLLN
ncbi:MAG TPA: Ig-like domain repeat protein [Pirellulales bacterium]|nr:Ig-like domain repeat protein [Pirellulales bacterium]